MRKLVPKIILEGTRLTQKTEIALALNEHPTLVGQRRYRYHSPVISAEWCGFTNRPWGRGLINFVEHEASLAMDTYATWAKLFENLRYYSWIIDRFHISTRAYQIVHHGKDYDLAWLEERLAALGFRLVLCTRAPESFTEARARRLEVSSNPGQYDDLDIFIREQELLRRLVEESSLERIEIDVSSGEISSSADQIAAWMESTGGLWMDDP
jgi:hypothetical protein